MKIGNGITDESVPTIIYNAKYFVKLTDLDLHQYSLSYFFIDTKEKIKETYKFCSYLNM